MNADRVSPKTIAEYIVAFPEEVQEILQEIRTIIKRAAPDAEETIKYQIPTFVLHGNLVHFAAYERHIGFYPGPSGIEAFRDELAAYRSAKGSVQFPLGEPIPFDLIRRVVEFRIAENRKRAAEKKRS